MDNRIDKDPGNKRSNKNTLRIVFACTIGSLTILSACSTPSEVNTVTKQPLNVIEEVCTFNGKYVGLSPDVNDQRNTGYKGLTIQVRNPIRLTDDKGRVHIGALPVNGENLLGQKQNDFSVDNPTSSLIVVLESAARCSGSRKQLTCTPNSFTANNGKISINGNCNDASGELSKIGQFATTTILK